MNSFLPRTRGVSHAPTAHRAAGNGRDPWAVPHVRQLREKIVRIGLKEFSPGGRLLELGCGVGDDTVIFARGGFSVTATDPSQGMLRLAAVKTAPHRTAIRLQALHVADLSPLGEAAFEGVFSNFGSLNSIGNISRFFSQARRIVVPGGALVICLFGRWSPWEIAGFLLRARGSEAFRRLAPSPVAVPAPGRPVPTWYHPAGKVIRAARPGFRLVRSLGVNVISPPPSSTTFALAYPRLTAALRGFEPLLSGFRPFSRMGDHVVYVFRKTP